MRLPRFPLLLAAVLLKLAAQSFAATEIPLESRDGMLWVRVTTASSGEPLHFLLDSGASASVLDLGTARRLGAKLGSTESVQGIHGRANAYRLPEFRGEIAGAAIPRSILALDLSRVSAVCHRRIDGLLGADFFRGRIVQIDYAAGKLRLLSRSEADASGSLVLPLATRNAAFCVRVSVADQPAAWTRVDTGCNSALQWVAKRSAVEKLNRTTIGLAPGAGRTISADVQLGAERIRTVKIGLHSQPIFAGEAGLLGNGLLSRFAKVTFDAPGKRLLLAGR